MKKYELGRLKIEIHTEIEPVMVKWKGESDARDPSEHLQPLFEEMVDLLKGRAVRLIFNELRYMNSSTVKPIMILMEELSKACKEIILEYSNDLQWQATSFRAMRIVAERKWKNVQVIGL